MRRIFIIALLAASVVSGIVVQAYGGAVPGPGGPPRGVFG